MKNCEILSSEEAAADLEMALILEVSGLYGTKMAWFVPDASDFFGFYPKNTGDLSAEFR